MHLFFTDDIMIFFKARDKECFSYQGYFEEREAQRLHLILRMYRSLDTDMYLRLPIVFERARLNEFKAVVQRVRNRVNQWTSQFLSLGRKEILIKACTQMPIFTMNCFLLLNNIVHELNRIIADYWWDDKGIFLKIYGEEVA